MLEKLQIGQKENETGMHRFTQKRLEVKSH